MRVANFKSYHLTKLHHLAMNFLRIGDRALNYRNRWKYYENFWWQTRSRIATFDYLVWTFKNDAKTLIKVVAKLLTLFVTTKRGCLKQHVVDRTQID